MLAVTGTDGKTTTTMMAAAMLRCAGLKAAAVGNTELPLIAALDSDVDAFVVECSSFRLNWIDHFRSEASVWLNLADDHQNWHVSMQAYEQRQGADVESTTDRPTLPSGTPRIRSSCATSHVAVGRDSSRSEPTTARLPRSSGRHLTGPAGALAERSMMTPRPSPRRHQRAGRGGDLDRVRPGDRGRRRRGAGDVRASAASDRADRRVRRRRAGSTTRRPPRHTPPSLRSAGSPTSCCWPAAATRASIWPAWPTNTNG